jgi:predicted ATP-grasp superfamily ATP-dependent carboligase
VRILVYEHITGGGLAGRAVPRSLAREGLAMRSALVEDLAAIGAHDIVVTTDERFSRAAPRGVHVLTKRGRGSFKEDSPIDDVAASCDAVWAIAPESDRLLERIVRRLERRDIAVIGSTSSAVRIASDKAQLPARLTRVGLRHPTTSLVNSLSDARAAGRRTGYPLVVKPSRGAGCRGVRLVRDPAGLADAVRAARAANGGGRLLVQSYVPGRSVSVSLLADGRHARPLAVNTQRMRAGGAFTYQGGTTPLAQPMFDAAAGAAVRVCTSICGLRGYVGVDLVMTDAGPVVIEVNPRLTTAYLGVRAVLDVNVSALALAAWQGRLPDLPSPVRRVRFSAAGRTWPAR